MTTLVITDSRSGQKAETEIGHGELSLGNDESNDIVLSFPEIADHHGEIRYGSDGCFVRAYKTATGMAIQGRRIQGEAPWPLGEELRIGPVALRLVEEKPAVDSSVGKYKAKVREILIEHPEVKRLIHTSANDAEMRTSLQKVIHEAAGQADVARPAGLSDGALVKEMVDEILGLGPLEDLMQDDNVQEIMVNRWDHILVERVRGRIERVSRTFLDEHHLIETLRRILAPIGRHVNETTPLVDARLKDGTRVNAVIPPVAVGGTVVTIRKFAREPFTLERLTSLGTLTASTAELLRYAVRTRLNIAVSGGTGSGKTSFLNALALQVPAAERMVILEDTHELRFQHPNTVYLEGRPASLEGQGAITIRRLLINSLRMRPDRIIVGECRGDEAFDMLQAMNTGHLGSMTTVHANTPRDALLRIENMTLMAGYDLPSTAIRRQVASALHLVIQLSREAKGGRRVSCISEVTGVEESTITMQDLYKLNEGGVLVATGAVPRFLQSLPLAERSRWIHAFRLTP